MCLVIATTLLILLVVPLFAPLIVTRDPRPVIDGNAPAQHISSRIAHRSHFAAQSDPIEIVGNEDFLLQGWPGNGTPEDPYVISDLTFYPQGFGIRVISTDVHFVVRNCTFAVGDVGPAMEGIELDHVVGARIENCSFANIWTSISIQSSHNITIEQCVVESGLDAVTVKASYDIIVTNIGVSWVIGRGVTFASSRDCELSDSSFAYCDRGLNLVESTDCVVTDNAFIGCQITITGSPDEWSHTIIGNTVDSEPLGYFWRLHDSRVDARGYGALILAGCNNVTVENGVWSGRVTPLVLAYSVGCVVRNITAIQSETAVLLTAVERTRVEDLTLYGNAIGLLVRESRDVVVSNVRGYGNSLSALSVSLSRRITVSEILAYHNSAHGVEVWGCNDTIVSASISYGNSFSGVYLYQDDNVTVRDCALYNNRDRGLTIDLSTDCGAIRCYSYRNRDGIGVIRSARTLVVQNDVHTNVHNGIEVRGTYYCTIAANNVSDNKGLGVSVSVSSFVTVAGNIIAYNSGGNARDDGSDNQWDDGYGVGNLWSDYNGTAPYRVPGIAESVDRFPRATDADGDGLSDWEETNVYGTNPDSADTDGDGASDRDEIIHGFDPTNSTDGALYHYALDALLLRASAAALILIPIVGPRLRRRIPSRASESPEVVTDPAPPESNPHNE